MPAKKSLAMFRLGAEYTDTYESADTIPELAEKIGLDPAALEATVSEFNAACRTDVEFDPTTEWTSVFNGDPDSFVSYDFRQSATV